MNRDQFEQMVLDDLREIRKNVSILTAGQAGLRVKVGMIAAAAGTVASFIFSALKGSA
tara:strand:- start:2063 stop:2236 length:174 start_codon:yes stop_codon:yes gene_type:complete